MDAPIVEPKQATGQAAEQATGQAAGELSPELLQIPAMMAIFAGSPPALSASISDFSKRPEAKLIVSHVDQLQKAGMGLYRSLDGATGVVFNSLYIHPDEIKAADQAGQLAQVAPPFDTVNHKVGTAHPNDHPTALHSGTVPMAPKSSPVPTPPQSGSPLPPVVAPPPASVQNKAQTARNAALQGGSPSSGPSPGAGNLLRNILKPVI